MSENIGDPLRDNLAHPQKSDFVRGNYSHEGHFLAKTWSLQQWADPWTRSMKHGSALFPAL